MWMRYYWLKVGNGDVDDCVTLQVEGVVKMRTYDGIKAERGVNLESTEFLERTRQ